MRVDIVRLEVRIRHRWLGVVARSVGEERRLPKVGHESGIGQPSGILAHSIIELSDFFLLLVSQIIVWIEGNKLSVFLLAIVSNQD